MRCHDDGGAWGCVRLKRMCCWEVVDLGVLVGIVKIDMVLRLVDLIAEVAYIAV